KPNPVLQLRGDHFFDIQLINIVFRSFKKLYPVHLKAEDVKTSIAGEKGHEGLQIKNIRDMSHWFKINRNRKLFEEIVAYEEGQSIGLVPPEVLVFQQLFHGFSQFRSEEHTSELQSRENLVCRLLLE